MSTLQTVFVVALIWGVFIVSTLKFLRASVHREREEGETPKKLRSPEC